VFPAKRLQVFILKRLNAERNPINPRSGKVFEFLCFHTGWVGFQSDLDCPVHRPQLSDGRQDTFRSGCCHQGRGATAKVHAGHLSRAG
tara:strand:+ start:3859 stop:4122 length:264 start_codon:yes stop_codon:yes gene_type:complete